MHLRFVNFSTLHARHAAAVREMEINRPHAPGIYLGLVPIMRDEGRLQLGGRGEIVEWAVHMRRFPQEAVLSHREEQGPLSDDLAQALADMIARYHQDSPIAPSVRRRAHHGIRRRAAVGLPWRTVMPTSPSRLVAAFERAKPLLVERGNAGCVRRCHGDLHLGNIVLIDNVPVPFDALEFSEALATIDVLYDLAFLLMDLDARGDRQAANAVLNAYVAFEPDRRRDRGPRLPAAVPRLPRRRARRRGDGAHRAAGGGAAGRAARRDPPQRRGSPPPIWRRRGPC